MNVECPLCRETIKYGALRCKHCQSDLTGNGLELEAVDVTVTDDDLVVAYKSLQESMATAEPAPKDYEAANGDVAVIDFLGKLNGKPFDGGKGENYSLSLGDGCFIPGFEEQVVGHKAGDSFDVTVTFPGDHHEESLKGRRAVFEVTLHQLKNKVLPEVDDDFARQVGDFDNLEALNEALCEQILEKRNQMLNEARREQVLEKHNTDEIIKAIGGIFSVVLLLWLMVSMSKCSGDARELATELQGEADRLEQWIEDSKKDLEELKGR